MPDAKTTPPIAKVVPASLEAHGHVRTDNYYWLNERDNPDVMAYLEAEKQSGKSVAPGAAVYDS
jgi:oligopeptidase B